MKFKIRHSRKFYFLACRVCHYTLTYKNRFKTVSIKILTIFLITQINLLFFAITMNKSVASEGFKHGISIFGDLKYSKNFQNFDYVNPNAPKGGHVKFGVEGTFNSFNQFILKGIPAAGISYIYDSLMEGSDDEISALYGLIAKEVKLSKDKMSIEFILNENARFHDGKQVTVDDVIFSFKTLTKDGHPSYKMSFRDVTDVKQTGKNKVKFYFKNNQNRQLPIMIASLSILPKHYYEKNDFDKTSLTPPLGSGPYKIKDFKMNNSITFERVKDYWAKDLPVNKGRYNFDFITYEYYRDNNVLIEAFKSQKYDFKQENIARNWANSYNIDAIKNGEIIKKEIKHSLPAPMQAFVFNIRKEKFQNLALRKAINYTFDFEWLRSHIFYNSYQRTNSYFANSDFSYDKFFLPKSTGDGFNRKNLIEAKKILDDARYKINKGILLDPKTNQPITIEFLIDQKAFEMIIAPFVKNLKKLGIVATIKMVEENQYQTRVNNFDFDIITAVFPQSLIPGNELFSYFHSSQKDVKGSRNLIGISDKNIDKLVENIANFKNKNDLQNSCYKLDQILLEGYYVVPQWYNNTHRILYRNIFGFPKQNPKYGLALDSWWIDNFN